MKTAPDCIPCILHKVLALARTTENNEWLHRRVLVDCMNTLAQCSFDLPPGANAAECLGRAQQTLGVQDPFAKVRKEQNQSADALGPRMAEAMSQAEDRFSLAVRLAAAGNEIQVSYDCCTPLPGLVDVALERTVDDETLRELREDVDKAQSVLYVLNNAGELFFDKVLVEEIAKSCDVTAVVGLSRTLNRATMADAEAADLLSACRVLEIGGVSGAQLPLQSAEFQKLYREVDLVIVKGQDNYGSLADQGREAYFLLSVKCACYAFDLGASIGDLVLTKR